MHVHLSTGAAFTWRLRLRLLRLRCPAAFSMSLVPVIDGIASKIATFLPLHANSLPEPFVPAGAEATFH